MPRSRVLSFMSQWGPRSPTIDSRSQTPTNDPFTSAPHSPVEVVVDTSFPSATNKHVDARHSPSPTTQQRFRSESRSGRSTRPMSMVQTYSPSLMDVAQDTLPELQPIFSFLNSHSNKLYQEGYFLKLHDLDSRGRPSADRNWTECFAQLVGTVLSLWDAGALDAAGEDGEVLPTFVNISDASIKMIESLPMNGSAGGQLQNVLSISTAANNRYLLHFNSLNSLTQWTAGIRLSMFEHATLQEAYTGSLIAGKGRMLNNIRVIMERSKFKTEDWARVRFGAGTPWRRCWCVISPPDEKEYAKAQKSLKKRDAYLRKVQIPKGSIKFYETRRVHKKTRPIATVSDAYAAYAIYPQSKPLVDQSTLVKLEGRITVHGATETTSEGFLFVMPEVHPAVSGFEMMLRWLFPVYDTFALYGRPTRLVADPLDQRGLMFAMPRSRRHGYLDTLDVSGLIHTTGSREWSEQDWRREMKTLTSHRMNSSGETPPQIRGRRNTLGLSSRTSLSLNHGRSGVRFGGDSSTNSSASTRTASPIGEEGALQFGPPRRVETTPAGNGSPGRSHNRSASEAIGYKRFQSDMPSRLSYEATVPEFGAAPPPPPAHAAGLLGVPKRKPTVLERIASESETATLGSLPAYEELELHSAAPPTVPVASPPKQVHGPNARPVTRPYVAPEIRRANSSIDAATLVQLAEATGNTPYTEKEPADYASASREVVSAALGNQRSHADNNSRYEGAVTLDPGPSHHHHHHHPHHQARRLPPIPASPYGSDPVPTSSAMYRENAPPPVPGHAPAARNNAQAETPARNLGSPPPFGLGRDPVPSHERTPPSPPAHRPHSPTLSVVSESESLRNELREQALFEQMLQKSPEPSPERVPRPASIHSTADDDSVDYSSVKSLSPPKRKPLERGRTGRLKTVGNPDMQPVPEAKRYQKVDIPDIDFGPTLSYRPIATAPASGGSTPATPLEEPETTQRPPSRLALDESRRSSYVDGRRTPSGDLHSEKRRSVAWQPATTPVESAEQGLTAEQWVQHRASMATGPQSRPTPVYGHSRAVSSGNRMSLSKTPPPLSRPVSGDWTQQLNRLSLGRSLSGDWAQASRLSLSKTPPPLSRTPSGDWSHQIPSRPGSRNAGTLLNPPSPGRTLQNAQSQSLSAREQMLVAKATGTPMLSLSQTDRIRNSDDAYAPGLIGAVAARERERAAKKEILRNSMVQQAIAARQQQQVQADLEAHMQQQYQVQDYAQQHAQLQAQQLAQQQAQFQAAQYAQQQAQMYAQHYAQQQAQLQAQQQAQAYLEYQHQQQAYQNAMQTQQGNSPYGIRPGMAQQRSSSYLGQVQGSQAGAWTGAGSPQPQGYAASYFGGNEGQYRQQQRRY